VESYRAILDSANSISVGNTPAPGRSAPGQSEEMDISPETMNSMQKNAVYGMEVLDAALKHVRGESPTVAPVSIPPPPTSAPTAARMVGQGPSNSVNTMTSSSSLAGAVSSPQEAPAPAASSIPKTNTAVKGNKDVGAIRVIEDGSLKKMENKEGGVKSGDRKRQVRHFLCYTSYSDAQTTFFPRKQLKTASMMGRLAWDVALLPHQNGAGVHWVRIVYHFLIYGFF
jgi:hypothetical protein